MSWTNAAFSAASVTLPSASRAQNAWKAGLPAASGTPGDGASVEAYTLNVANTSVG